jgi:hypothetical protein
MASTCDRKNEIGSTLKSLEVFLQADSKIRIIELEKSQNQEIIQR